MPVLLLISLPSNLNDRLSVLIPVHQILPSNFSQHEDYFVVWRALYPLEDFDMKSSTLCISLVFTPSLFLWLLCCFLESRSLSSFVFNQNVRVPPAQLFSSSRRLLVEHCGSFDLLFGNSGRGSSNIRRTFDRSKGISRCYNALGGESEFGDWSMAWQLSEITPQSEGDKERERDNDLPW